MAETLDLSTRIADGSAGRIRVIKPVRKPVAAVYWLPALGVGLRPNEHFAEAVASQDIAVVIHEWRGMGESGPQPSRRHDWDYARLLTQDIPAGLHAAREALPLTSWFIGGHSLGAQLALISAALNPDDFKGIWFVAGGHPWWRTFPGAQSWQVLMLSLLMRPLTALYGYFPGQRLGFAGREARTLMREWAQTARTGAYPLPSMSRDVAGWLSHYRGSIAAVRMTRDDYAPAASLRHLQHLTPQAEWQIHVLGAEDFSIQRADHFSWLKDPGPVATRLTSWTKHQLKR
ncbi:MAG: alpha/beta fold hydrolase [Wenzhouxiangellaceae bacterium]